MKPVNYETDGILIDFIYRFTITFIEKCAFVRIS